MGNFAQTSLQLGDHKQRERRERLVAAAGCDETSVKQSDESVSEWSMVKAKRCEGSSCRSKE